jgi:hypothetical protein
VDASELQPLVFAFEKAEHDLVQGTYKVVEEQAGKLRDDWKANARLTARRHGRRNPNAITAEQIPAGDVEWEVGPESARPQGGMGRGFEFGGPYQPPHWDGARASVKREPAFTKALEDLMGDVL